MKLICLICARSGSKRIKNKNIIPFNGIPLIANTILMAKKIKQISKIYVSTDSNKIANISKKYGAEVPFIRPKYLSQDNTPEFKVWKYFEKSISKIYNDFDAIIILPTTSPLRKTIDINKCISKYKTNKYELVLSLRDSSRNPYFNMVKKNRFGYLELVNKTKKKFFTSQSSPIVYDLTTIAYIINRNSIRSKNNMFDCKIGGVTIPKDRSIDIDDHFDLKLAEILLNKI